MRAVAPPASYSLLATRYSSAMSRLTPSEVRPVELKILPDGRRRLTRFRVVNAGFGITDTLVKPWGTLDAGPVDAAHQREGFANLRLVDQFSAEPGTADVSPDKLVWVEVYETLPATGEVQVGGNTTRLLEDGRAAVQAEFLQLSADTFAPGTSGTTTAPGDSAAFLQDVKQVNDGTLRRITRTYVHEGIISTDEQIREGGALTLKTIVSVKTVPTTPSGYTLIGKPTQNPAGLPVYSYAYAKGTGLVFTQERDALDGAITYQTKRAYGTPVAATGEFDTSTEQGNGYTVYISRGIIINTADLPDEITTRNKGNLVITRKRKINAVPTGTGSVVFAAADPEEGYTLYTRAFALGEGLVSTSTRDHLNGAVTYTTKRAYGSPVAATGEFETTTENDDGYTVYVSRGLVINTATLPDRVETRNQGKLVITRRSKINSAPSTPAATLGGSVVRTDLSPVPAEGYTLYSAEFYEGVGTVIATKKQSNQGKLVTYRRVALGAAPTAPSATLGGTVVLIDDETREDSGHTVYDYTWAEGKGVVATREQQRPGGLKLVTWVSLGQAYDAAYMLPAGVLMAKDSDDRDGHTVWTVTTMQLAAGGADPTSGSALSLSGYHPFRYPGRAKAIVSTILGYNAYEVYRSPAVDVLVDATTLITYSTTASLGTLPAALWNPDSWATIIASYWALSGWPKAVIESLPGYRSISETPLAFTGMLVSCLGELCYPTGTGTPYSLAVKGGPANPEGNTYTLAAEIDPEPAFVAYDGTKYYRRTFVIATIPPQPALPV